MGDFITLQNGELSDEWARGSALPLLRKLVLVLDLEGVSECGGQPIGGASAPHLTGNRFPFSVLLSVSSFFRGWRVS